MRPEIAQTYKQLLHSEEIPKELGALHDLAQEYSGRVQAGLLTPQACCVLGAVYMVMMEPKKADEQIKRISERNTPVHAKTDANKHVCANCGKTFIDQKTLDQHFKREHKGLGGK